MKVVAVKTSLASELRAPVEQLQVIAGRLRSPLLILDLCGDEVPRLLQAQTMRTSFTIFTVPVELIIQNYLIYLILLI